jgi:hypothetical protein
MRTEFSARTHPVPDFLVKNVFQPFPATQMNAQLRGRGEDAVHADDAGMVLAGDGGFNFLFGLGRKNPPLVREGQRGGPSDFIERAADMSFFAFVCIGAHQGQHVAFLGPARPEFGQRGHGIPANLFVGIFQQATEPTPRFLSLLQRAGFRKNHSHRANDGHPFHPLPGPRPVECRDLFVPESVAR